MNESAIAPLPFGVEWRIRTASIAGHLFSHDRDPKIDHVLGMPAREAGSKAPPLTVTDLLRFLNLTERENQPPGLYMVRLIADMVRVGLLMDNPTTSLLSPNIFGRSYWTVNTSGVQLLDGQLWLSELIGAGLIIPSYGSVAVPIAGIDASGEPAIGSGLLLDATHIVTNSHVVRDMRLDQVINLPVMRPPTSEQRPHVLSLRVSGEPWVHERLDVAVIELDPSAAEGVFTLQDMTFREPMWGDETYVFGYPPVPTVRDDVPLIVQQGEVVNPLVTSYEGDPYFLYSAITRPGNSGGPVVAQDGRVIGLVAHEASDKGKPAEAPFFRGIPSGAITEALAEMGLAHLIKLDKPVRTPTGEPDGV